MSTFEKLCKADHVLLWMGDDRYLEVKPLQVKSSVGNLVEWQQLEESIDHLHEKNLLTKRHHRTARSTASIRTLMKKTKTNTSTHTVSPPCTRTGIKRESKVSIDYKQFHEDDTFEEKKRRTEKFLPMSSGPSELHFESQKHIVKNKKSPKTPPACKVVTSRQYNLLRKVVVSNIPQNPIKKEHNQFYLTKIIKPEPGIFMTH